MRLTYLLYPLSLLLACGPDGGTSDTASESSATTAANTTDPTSSTAPTTTTTTTATTTATTDDTTGTSTSSTTTGDTTTGAPAEPCLVDADCMLQDDCCTCTGVPLGTDTPECPGECRQSSCTAAGIDAAVCRLGVCETERLSCDASKIACDQLPPKCDPGTLPGTTENCYTGACVPAFLCDVVPDCSACPADKFCVQYVAFGVEKVTCEPVPPGCDGLVDCACVGDLVCSEPFGVCTSQGAVVSCECATC